MARVRRASYLPFQPSPPRPRPAHASPQQRCHCPAVCLRVLSQSRYCAPAVLVPNATASIPRAPSIVARFTLLLPRLGVFSCAHAAQPHSRLRAHTVAHHHAHSREPVSGAPDPRCPLARPSPSCSARPPPYRYYSSSPSVCCCSRHCPRPLSPASPLPPTGASTLACWDTAKMASATVP